MAEYDLKTEPLGEHDETNSDLGFHPKVTGSLGLTILWSSQEPARVGELCIIPPSLGEDAMILGRDAEGLHPNILRFMRQSAGHNEDTGALRGSQISRRQVEVKIMGGRQLSLTHLGRGRMKINGTAYQDTLVSPGDLIEISGRLLLLCTPTHPHLPALPGSQKAAHTFAGPDSQGIVGESPSTWMLRRKIAAIAKHGTHVLILGPSGSGKELVARAIHSLSPRKDKALVARNAATFPEGLMVSELFGHAPNYPNSGMPARPGLIGEADKGTLFLDEIGELDHTLQSQLLRVMDQGEYHRLGESKARRANLRLVAATNRRRDELKHDLAARFPIVIEVEGLDQRRGDIPLLAQHLILSLGEKDPSLVQPFLGPGELGDGRALPRFSLKLMSALVAHSYQTHTRELGAALWDSVLESQGDTLELTQSVKHRLGIVQASVSPSPGDPSEVDVRRALRESGGVKEKAWRLLGLKNRFQLRRLMQKYGLDT